MVTDGLKTSVGLKENQAASRFTKSDWNGVSLAF